MTVAFELDGQPFAAIERRSGVHVLAGDLIRRGLPNATGSGSPVGKTFRRRGATTIGWLKDKYGVTWQIVPVLLGELDE